MTGFKGIYLEKVLLLAWFVVNLGMGALTVRGYGMSIDEPNNYRYAADTLDAYPSLFGKLFQPKYDSSYDGHGPAFVVIAGTLINIVQAVFPDAFEPDLWHYSYFVTFQLTGLCLYWLTRRWFSIWTAWCILLLFGSQPLLLGHAFINPKDIPFMFLLTASILLGFRLVDSMDGQESFFSLERFVKTLTDRFRQSEPRRRRRFLVSGGLGLAIALALVVFSLQANALIEQVITFFHTAEADSWAGWIFTSVASPAPDVPAENYVSKTLRLFHRSELVLLIVGVLFFLAYFGLLISNATVAVFLRNTWKRRQSLHGVVTGFARQAQDSLNPRSLKLGFMQFLGALRNRHLILAGVALGLATGVRAIAPWAGVIVLLCLFSKVRKKTWAVAIAYFLVAGVMTYLGWPRLWDAPIQRYLEGLGILSNFPHFPGQVLFNGQFYGPSNLPRSYLPVLLSIQFTEPAILSAYFGFGLLLWRLMHNRLRTDLLLYIGLGFAFPLFGLILLNSPLYHNFRQVLFLIPAMFMLAAFPLELVFSKMTRSWARVLLIAVLALPGIYPSLRMYPYEYVYYNSLVGGSAGVRNRFELDYWRISLREVAQELNELAPPGAIVVVTRSAGLLARYARPDLVVDKNINSTLDLTGGYDYLVQIARWQRWDLYPGAKNVVVIEREGVVLATAKDVRHLTRK